MYLLFKEFYLNLNLFAKSNERETPEQNRLNITGTQIYILLTIVILYLVNVTLSLLE